MTQLTAEFGRPGGLKKTFSSLALFTISFGVMVGSAWIVIIGDWFAKAGPFGAILGLTASAAFMSLVCMVYGELAARMPASGGEIVYSYKVFGPTTAYWVSWIYTVPVLAFVVFEGIALTWMVNTLFPNFGTTTLYKLLGYDVSLGQVGIGVVIVLAMVIQNYLGAEIAAGSQKVLTIAFLVIALAAIVVALSLGSVDNLKPLVFSQDPNTHWWMGSMAIFSSGLVWFSGFQAIPPVIEERRSDVTFSLVTKVMVASIAFAALFYGLVIIAVGMAVQWPSMLSSHMLTAAAFEKLLPGGWLAKAILVAGVISILKVWNGAFLWATRVLLVQSRAQFLPATFSSIHPKYRTPTKAVFLVGMVNIIGIAIGPGAILPILDAAAACIGIAITSAPIALLVIRLKDKSSEEPVYKTPGGMLTIVLSIIGMVCLTAVAIIQPFVLSSAGIPISMQFLIGWVLIGAVRWMYLRRTLDPVATEYALISRTETAA
ncbi:APC family permease [Pseudomonas asiatica]|uniref:APC family permease n=1 Tax=Pseudomonas asiatica TaxID=2219225 RepID=UPI0018A9AE76|nr:APC family permease [Pseudomonas asiatica]MBF8803512.1 APC family permease [Pseudomonas asiatica]